MTDRATLPDSATVKPASPHTSNRRQKYIDELDAADRHKTTEESAKKIAELVKERISVRDFDLEAVNRARAERNRRADEYAAIYRAIPKTEAEKRLQAWIMKEHEEEVREVEEAKRKEEEDADARRRGEGGDKGDKGDPMDMTD